MADVREEAQRVRGADGIRALAIAWIVAFHVLWFLSFAGDPRHGWAVVTQYPFIAVFQGPYGVDVLLVLSGFLIGGYVFRQLRRGRFSLTTYFIRRAARLYPAYLGALAIYAFFLPHQLSTVWANLLFVNNYLPYAQQVMQWTWTLGIEVHFYVLFPLAMIALRNRRWYLPVLLVALAASIAVRAYVVLHDGITLPWPSSPAIDPTHFAYVYDVFYDKTHTRIGAVIFGLLVAYACEYADVRAALTRHAKLASGLALAALALLALYVAVPDGTAADAARLGSGLSAFYLITSDDAIAIASAYLLLFVSVEAPRAVLRGFLSSRLWYWPAEVSYSAFLINPLVIMGAYAFVLHPGRVTALQAIGYELVLVPLTYVLAAALHLVVERPLRGMARRYTSTRLEVFPPPAL